MAFGILPEPPVVRTPEDLDNIFRISLRADKLFNYCLVLRQAIMIGTHLDQPEDIRRHFGYIVAEVRGIANELGMDI